MCSTNYRPFELQEASEPIVGPSGECFVQVWLGLHLHIDPWPTVVPPAEQVQGDGQLLGHVGQRCQDAPSWDEPTTHWPFIGHRAGH